MKRYKISFNGPSGEEGNLCFYSRFGIDTYRSGCKHECLYCYARSQNKHQYKNWHPDNPSILDTDWLRKQFENAFETDKKPNKVTSILRQGIPIRIGMNSDPFNPHERNKKITYETLKIFNEYEYPFLIFTKSALAADDNYLSLYHKDRSYIEMTVTSLNTDYTSKLEPGATSPRERINAIDRIAKQGIKTAFRINPLFPIHPDGYYTNKISSKDENKLDYFNYNLVEQLTKTKPHCIIAGFLRVCNRVMRDEIFERTGIDLNKYFIRNNNRYYSKEEIGEYYKRIKAICENNDTLFSVCFDTDSNYDTFRHMWANQSDCCCAKGMIPDFNKTAIDAK